MSSSNTARTNDAATLAALGGTGRRDALLRLGGDRGGLEAAHAQRSVDTIRQAAQARRLVLPELPETARARRAAVIAGNRAPLPDEGFRRYWAATEEWQILVGVHVTFERHNDEHTQYLTAVVLEVIPGTARGDAPGGTASARVSLDKPQLRLGLSCEALGQEIGDVTSISACHWHCSPSPADVLAAVSRDSRRQGRPLYAECDVPTDVLATPGELTLRRKLPATLQPPIASVRRSRGATDLYAIPDAEDLPTAAQAKPSIDQRRTCASCGRSSPSPWSSTADGARHCPDHYDAARLRVDAALVARNRAVSAVWAREVLADPDTVLVAMLGAPRRFACPRRRPDRQGPIAGIDRHGAARDAPTPIGGPATGGAHDCSQLGVQRPRQRRIPSPPSYAPHTGHTPLTRPSERSNRQATFL